MVNEARVRGDMEWDGMGGDTVIRGSKVNFCLICLVFISYGSGRVTRTSL